MNHGVPAAGSAPDVELVDPHPQRREIGHRARPTCARGRPTTSEARRRRCQAASDSLRALRARRRAARERRAGRAATSPSSSGCTPTSAPSARRGSSESWKRTSAALDVARLREMHDRPRRKAARRRGSTTRRAASQAGGRGSGSVHRCRVAEAPGRGSLTAKMSAKSASSSSASSISTRRRPWFSTVIRSSMHSPTKRSRSIDSSFGSRPPASGLRRTKRARCGAGCAARAGAPAARRATVSTQRDRKRVSAAKRPDATACRRRRRARRRRRTSSRRAR